MTQHMRRQLQSLRRTDPSFREAERFIRAEHPTLSEFDAVVTALTWLGQVEYAGEVLAKANPGLTQVQ
jgi:hypothetical protein